MRTYDEAHLKETMRVAFEDPLVYKVPKGITRYDYAQTHGWWVRVTRDGAHFRKIFSDGLCDSCEDALRKAILYRHELLASFPVTIRHVHSRVLSQNPKNRIELKTTKGKNTPYVFWEAKWHDEDYKVKKQSFSVQKYGEEEARLLAFAAARSNHNKKQKISTHPDVYEKNAFKEIIRADIKLLATVDSTRYSDHSSINKGHDASVSYPHGFEGAKKYVLHLAIERDRRLRDQKVRLFLETHGKLLCELCHFNFVEAYPFLERDIIEVHHVVPLKTLNERTEITLDDLILLCANCHLAVHQGDAGENLLSARAQFGSDGNAHDC